MMSGSTATAATIFATAHTEMPTYTAQYRPTTAVQTINLPPGSTALDEWEGSGNPDAGIRELRWFEDHLQELEGFQGLWVAILGERVVASGSSMAELRREMDTQRITDALVVRVPEDVTRREYFIG